MKLTSLVLLTALVCNCTAHANDLDNAINDTINSVTQALNQHGDDVQDNDDGQWHEALSDNERQRYNDVRRQLDERRRQINEQQRQLDEQRRALNEEERRLDDGG